jgi:tRNA-binding EMAP/Myf-like protein
VLRNVHTQLYALAVLVVTGGIVGEVRLVRPHPQGSFIRLADVNLGNNRPVQIVFGGARELVGGELVAVAPPGSRVHPADVHPSFARTKKMRIRRFRGERSHGMLCSLDELGWLRNGPDEVAVLRDLALGQSLDDLPAERRPAVVVDWERAATVAEKRARTPLTEVFDPRWECGEPVVAESHWTGSRLVVHQRVGSGSSVAGGS